MIDLLTLFNKQWDSVPLCVIDTETTGKQPGVDKTVSFGISRFENGKFVASYEQIVDPGISIPKEATDIHGITNEMVSGQPSLNDAWAEPRVKELISDAQPCGYNHAYDKHFIPPFGTRWDWPFLDPLVFVRKIDRYISGKGKQKLGAACERHGVSLVSAHSAGADARACGELMYVLGRKMVPKEYTMGQLLGWQLRVDCAEWLRFHQWLANQPPLENQ